MDGLLADPVKAEKTLFQGYVPQIVREEEVHTVHPVHNVHTVHSTVVHSIHPGHQTIAHAQMESGHAQIIRPVPQLVHEWGRGGQEWVGEQGKVWVHAGEKQWPAEQKECGGEGLQEWVTQGVVVQEVVMEEEKEPPSAEEEPIEEPEPVKSERKTEFDALWITFTAFEEYTFDEQGQTFTAFLTEWQKRLTLALEAGLNYSETVLSLKLLRSSGLDKETRTNVFLALQSRPDFMQANLLLFTLNALNSIKKENHAANFDVKTEMMEEFVSIPKAKVNNFYKSSYEEDPEEEDFSYENERTSEDVEGNTDSSNPYKCKECPMTCPRLQEFQRHEQCHEGPVRAHPCSRCTASFDKVGLLEKHLIVHTDSRMKCTICEKEFFGDKALKYHMKNVHKKHLKCPNCPKTFERHSKLEKHMETHVKRQLATESMFQCDACGKEVQGKKRLRIHKRTHFQFKCQPCNKIFKDEDLLNRHILNHREYPCDQCGQVYFQLALLQKHKNTITHGGERKFSCDQCGKTFMKKYNLQTHQLTHTGEKNYKCEFEDCAMAFYKKDVMIRHTRIHTGEKPYQCDVCERRFTQSGDMRKHRRTHGID